MFDHNLRIKLTSLETKLDTMINDGLLLNGATLTDILAKIIVAPASEAKQDVIKSVLDTLGTEITLSALETLLTSLDGKDYATQVTLAALNTAFGAEDFSSEITLASVLTKLTELDNKVDAISNADNMNVTQVGNTVSEQLNETDAVLEVLTFSANIENIEIYHDEASPQDFIINGLTLKVASGGWRSPIGGTPSAEVTIPAAITCTITRLV